MSKVLSRHTGRVDKVSSDEFEATVILDSCEESWVINRDKLSDEDNGDLSAGNLVDFIVYDNKTFELKLQRYSEEEIEERERYFNSEEFKNAVESYREFFED